MSGRTRELPAAATASQIAAADPDRSVFVSANAGSGKTHVLVQRVINLLLRGEDPAKILCITFTKAAAANMASRVFDTLATWATLDDAALDEHIRKATGKPSDAAQRARARRLFASALETPGGLKVQTIHAFCTRLLHQFPFEADVAARFEVLDEAATSEMLNRLTLDVILDGAKDPESALGRALGDAVTAAADVTFKEVIAETIRKRDFLTAWIARAGGVPQAIAELTRAFGLEPGDDLAVVEDAYFSRSLIPPAEWPALIALLSTSDKDADRRQADRLAAAMTASGRDRIESYLDIFCTNDRKRRAGGVLTKQFAEDNPEWAARLEEEKDRVCTLHAKELALRARDRSAALIIVASAVIERYTAEKERRGLLDYEDLISKTLALFRKTSAAWVLYKLDLGINHVLVDEAQDTSPEQWEIITTLVSEFVQAGARADVKRTVFAVGDEKQSIFSFQGAEPLAFARMREHFRKLHERGPVPFADEKLHFSFRSAAEVLEAVDTVFRQPQAFRGLTSEAVWTVHQALPDAAPGEVEVWELAAPDEKAAGKEGWDAPFDLSSETSPSVKLAARVARTVKDWTAQGVRPRDVLILVRQRGPFFEAVIRALKREAIDVAGADRLVLTEHIAIMDLLALADALLLPDDDLALATVLKSPLFGFDEEQIYALAHGRTRALRSELRARAGEDPMFAAAAEALDALAAKARAATPFEFYSHVLGAQDGRARFLSRLGIEASDPIDEFLNLALLYEQRQTPTLQGFAAWMRAARSEVKRDMEMARDEVRVMTVHGAKGLEARNVILVDTTTTRPEGAHPPRLLTVPLPHAAPGAEGLVWAVARDKDAGPMEEARTRAIEAAKDEYRRLLYVGLTRAAERLIVCGTKGEKKVPEGCWHELVLGALKPLSTEIDTPDGKIWRFRKLEAATPAVASRPTAAPELPDWLRRRAAPASPTVRALFPSATDGAAGAARPGAADAAGTARLRGKLTHRLLQSLPDVPPERRARAAADFLNRVGDKLPEAERKLIAAQAIGVLDDARFHRLFGPGSRAEVPIVGKVTIGADTHRVSGQVDRLAVTADAVLIADFKSNRPAPRRIEDVPPAYLRQLALYRAVLATLYPGRPVHCALVWTEVPELMELSGPVLDRALAQISPA